MEYSWFTMLDWFVLYCKVDQLYTYPLFFRLFSHLGHYRVMSSLCYAALLSILYTVVCICQCQIPSLSPHFSPDNHKSIFYICDCFINKFICASFKVIVYDMSLSDYFTQYDNIKVHPMLLQMALFHSFLWLIFYCICMYPIFFILSSVDGHLGCFLALAIVNSAAKNTRLHVLFQIMISSEYMPRSGITQSYVRALFLVS